MRTTRDSRAFQTPADEWERKKGKAADSGLAQMFCVPRIRCYMDPPAIDGTSRTSSPSWKA